MASCYGASCSHLTAALKGLCDNLKLHTPIYAGFKLCMNVLWNSHGKIYEMLLFMHTHARTRACAHTHTHTHAHTHTHLAFAFTLPVRVTWSSAIRGSKNQKSHWWIACSSVDSQAPCTLHPSLIMFTLYSSTLFRSGLCSL